MVYFYTITIMKIKDLLSQNQSHDSYRDDAVCVLAEFAEKWCYTNSTDTYFIKWKLIGNRQEQLETEIVTCDVMVDEQVDHLFDFVMLW